MRIFECSDSFLPVMDGVGRVVYQYASLLPKHGHECYVIAPMKDTGYRGGHPFELVDYLSIRVLENPAYNAGIAQFDPHYMERIADIRPDVVHAHNPGPSGFEAIRLAQKWKAPLVATFHSKYYDDILTMTRSALLASVGSRFVAEFYVLCDDVWTVSEEAACTLRSYGFKGNITVMPNGTEIRTPDPSWEDSARRHFNLGRDPILLYVGQIDHKKNLRRVLETAALLKDRARRFQLVLAGQGRHRADLEKQARKLGLENVVFTGHLSDPQLLDGLYMAAALFIFPSLYDTSGLVVREAAVMGTPSVVVENTAPAEVISDGVNGLVCRDDPADLGRAIERYLFEMNDVQRSAMRARAQTSVPMSWDKVMTMVEDRYREISSQVNPRRSRRLSRLRERIHASIRSLEPSKGSNVPAENDRPCK